MYQDPAEFTPKFPKSGANSISLRWVILTQTSSAKFPMRATGRLSTKGGKEGTEDPVWRLALSIPKVDLDVDSDNNNGLGDPDHDEKKEDKIEDDPSKLGKIIPENISDVDSDGIPDYADFTISSGGVFIPMFLEVTGLDDLSEVKIRIDYSGLATLPSDSNFEGKDIKVDFKDYKDYSAVKKGAIRIWTASGTRDKKDIVDGGNYIVPGKEYTAEELFGSGNSSIKLYIENIKLNGLSDIKATAILNSRSIGEDTVKVRGVSGNIGVNSKNDTKFTIKSKDEKIEDQLEGFAFWGSSVGDAISTKTIVDLFPALLKIPKKLIKEKWGFYLKIEKITGDPIFTVFNNVSPSNNRIEFLQETSTAEKQLDETSLCQLTDTYKLKDVKEKMELLFRGAKYNRGIGKIILMTKEPNTDNKIPLDSFKFTIKETKKFFHAVSVRGTPNKKVTYPTEKGRVVKNFSVYPSATPLNGYGSINANKEQILLFIHGYNVSEGGAEEYWQEMYKRFYWSKFRGNLVCIGWEGDEGPWLIAPLYFGTNVENALQSSWAVAEYIKDLKNEYGRQKIDMVTHSLGNLVGIDALRLLSKQSGKYIRNVLLTEAAIWPEVLLRKEKFSDNGFTYGVSKQQKVSWWHWGYKCNKPVSGRFVNAYNPNDSVLEFAMRAWQAYLADSRNNIWEKFRTNNLKKFRTPQLLWHDIPGWPKRMEKSIVPSTSSYKKLRLPMGASSLPWGLAFGFTEFPGDRYNWIDGLHGHSSWELQPYYKMYKWFDLVFYEKVIK